MARNTGGNRGDVRKSALWGSGNRGGEFRSNALWGKGGRGSVVTLVGVLVLSLAAGAASARGTAPEPARGVDTTVVEPGLLEKAQANPKQKFKIIVQSAAGAKAAETAFGTVESQDDQQLVKDEATADKNERKANEASSGKKSKSEQARYKAERERWKAEKESCEGSSSDCSGPARRPVRVHRRCLARDVGPAAAEARQGSGSHHHRGCPGRFPRLLSGEVRPRRSSCGHTRPASAHSGTGLPARCRRSRSWTPASTRPCPASPGRNVKQLSFVSSGNANRSRRRSRSRQLRRRHRCRLGEGLCRCGSECSARLARRHGRLRLRSDE